MAQQDHTATGTQTSRQQADGSSASGGPPVTGNASALDVAPIKRRQHLLPAWLRSIFWAEASSHYDAFLSYSWKSDKQVAPILQSVIQGFLRPWYKTRAKTVFRDLSSLPAGSSLEAELFRRIDRSMHFLALASPGAATSAGMELEARHWFSRKREGEVLVVVTDGTPEKWDDIRDKLLPPIFRENLVPVAHWVPLQHRRAEILISGQDTEVKGKLVEDLKQVLLRFYPGMSWEELRGEERSQRRRTTRLVSGVALLLFVLFVAASFAAWYARTQWAIAESRALAAKGEQMFVQGQRNEALNYGFHAWRTAKTPEAHLLIAHSFVTVAAKLEGHTGFVWNAAFSRDGQRIVTASHDQTAGVWNAANGQLLSKLEGHTGSVLHAAFSPDGRRILTASEDHTARVWNAANGQLLSKLEGHTLALLHAAFSPDGQRILTASEDHTARVWNTANGQLLSKLEGHTDSVWHATFSPDGQRILTASEDHTARVWNAANGQLLVTLGGHTNAVGHAAFSPDGQRILTASFDKTARVWNAANGQLLSKLEGHTDVVRRAVFSPDGQRILTASDDATARVWNAANGQLLVTLKGHTGSVWNAAFSPDGQRILTASDDTTAGVWNAANGQLLVTLEGHTADVGHAVFSPDGQRILTASLDPRVVGLDVASVNPLYAKELTRLRTNAFALPPIANTRGVRLKWVVDRKLTQKELDTLKALPAVTWAGHVPFRPGMRHELKPEEVDTRPVSHRSFSVIEGSRPH